MYSVWDGSLGHSNVMLVEPMWPQHMSADLKSSYGFVLVKQCCRSRIHSLVTRVSDLYKISALFHQALCFPPVMWKRGKGLLSGHAVCLSWRKGNGALYCYWTDIAVVDKDYPGICFWTDPLSLRHSLKRTAYAQDTLLKLSWVIAWLARLSELTIQIIYWSLFLHYHMIKGQPL